MRTLLASASFLIAGFFALTFCLGVRKILLDATGPYTDKHGWAPFIAMQIAMVILATLFICIGLIVLGRKDRDPPA